MKKLLELLLFGIAAIVSAICCTKENLPITPSDKDDLKIIKLRSVGEPSPNPVNLSHCILPESQSSLESFRHVSKGRLYYMDYNVSYPYENLIVTDSSNRYKVNGYKKLTYDFNKALYSDAVMGGWRSEKSARLLLRLCLPQREW